MQSAQKLDSLYLNMNAGCSKRDAMLRFAYSLVHEDVCSGYSLELLDDIIMIMFIKHLKGDSFGNKEL